MERIEIESSKLSAEDIEKVRSIRAKVQLLMDREKRILNRKSKQERIDDTRRAIIIGKLFLKETNTDKRMKNILESLLNGVEPNAQYLFPDRWPEATRPTRKRAE